jgi:hypothetical protein
MRANGTRTSGMDLGMKGSAMATFMRANILKARSMAKANMYGQAVSNTKVNGLKVIKKAMGSGKVTKKTLI